MRFAGIEHACRAKRPVIYFFFTFTSITISDDQRQYCADLSMHFAPVTKFLCKSATNSIVCLRGSSVLKPMQFNMIEHQKIYAPGLAWRRQ